MLKYIELKSNYNDDGPAWIGLVSFSKSKKTIYFNGKCFKKPASNMRKCNNHYDIETGDEYWISGIKKNGLDRHWAGKGKINIEKAAIPEYLKIVGQKELDLSKFTILDNVEPVDRQKMYELENRIL